MDIQAAISVDGFVAKSDGDSDWVQDSELFEQLVREYGCMCMGSTTFTQYENDLFPMDGIEHLVLSNKTHATKHSNVHFVNSVDMTIAKAKELGFDKLLVIGGGQTNGSFLAAGVVDKIMLDIHPLIFGEGKRLFGDLDKEVHLQLVDHRQEDGFMVAEYTVHDVQVL